jgi:rhodanese-related sulfurtransferase
MQTLTEFLTHQVGWIAAASISGGYLLFPLLGKKAGSLGISPQEAVRLMNDQKAIVVDMRSQEECEATGLVKQAVRLDAKDIEGQAKTWVNKAQTVVFYCAGDRRATQAAKQVEKLLQDATVAKEASKGKPTKAQATKSAKKAEVYVLQGGFKAWLAAGLPVSALPSPKGQAKLEQVTDNKVAEKTIEEAA